jgi:hypothetical protein
MRKAFTVVLRRAAWGIWMVMEILMLSCHPDGTRILVNLEVTGSFIAGILLWEYIPMHTVQACAAG